MPEPIRPTAKAPIRSEFAGDPEMSEIIGMFVGEMPSRVASLKSAWEARQLDQLKRISHQLKGASGGYGFSSVGQAAGQVENLLKQVEAGLESAAAAKLQAELDRLIDLCNRVTHG